MSKIIKEDGNLVDGQAILETRVSRRVSFQKPLVVVAGIPRAMARDVSAAFGKELKPLTGQQKHRDKLLRIECTKLRWMKPGPDGTLVPR